MDKKKICKTCHYFYEHLTLSKTGLPLGLKTYCAHWGMYDDPKLFEVYRRIGKATLEHQTCDGHMKGCSASKHLWSNGIPPLDPEDLL